MSHVTRRPGDAPARTPGGAAPPCPGPLPAPRGGRWWVACALAGLWAALATTPATPGRDEQPPEGFVPLFNGKDLSGWRVPEGDGGHWKVIDGVIDYDAESEAKGDKSLWTEA